LYEPRARRPATPADRRRDRTLAPQPEDLILLEHYFLRGDLEAQIEAFVEHYNHQCNHESLDNLTPADAYFGWAPAIIKQRERIKRQAIEHRRLQHRKLAA
jgi:putative transposase